MLYQALPKADKLELVIQKATELGAIRIVPVQAERSVVQLKGDRAEGKISRWQKIAQEAAEQCERGRVPTVEAPTTLKGLDLPAGTLGLVLSERAEGLTLPRALPDKLPEAIALFVGPEGGWTPAELDLLRGKGVREVSLGQRILRTETAGLTALAMILAAYELA
jgi:16S rRNA (uracil1498-N3)-methyltransferase